MKLWMAVAIVATTVRIADAAEPVAPRTLDLQMRTETAVSSIVLEQSQEEVTRIFAEAGVTVRWARTSPRYTVTIVSQVLGFDRAASSVMGVALRKPIPGVQVFFKQVQDFSRTYELDLSTMLAHVIAHEIGHLMLPGYGHSPTGLMQPAWDKAVARDVRHGSLAFTQAQAAGIRASR
jgi:hypothetical protein